MTARVSTRLPFNTRFYLELAIFLPAALALAIVAVRAVSYRASSQLADGWPASAWVGLLALGLLCWTLIEYSLHRFAFHHRASSALGARIVYSLHMGHHQMPEDPRRTVASPAFSILMAVSLFLLLLALARDLAVASVLMIGIILGYTYYETVHFLVHHSELDWPIIRFYRNYHFLHHYQDDTRRFGVTSPLWDIVFRTR